MRVVRPIIVLVLLIGIFVPGFCRAEDNSCVVRCLTEKAERDVNVCQAAGTPDAVQQCEKDGDSIYTTCTNKCSADSPPAAASPPTNPPSRDNTNK
jgi:hypothetical protein